MKLSTKAALYSGLLFPGSGFFIVKKPWLALAFLIPAVAALGYIMVFISHIVSSLTEQILAGKISPNLPALTEAVAAAMNSEGASFYTLAKTVLVISWLTSIALSYYMGQQYMEQQSEKNEEQNLPQPPK